MALIGRFAPSPSGRMHLGNVFAALLAWLSARSRNGTMLLRMEDLDPDRCNNAYMQQLREDLLWLGLDWDQEQPPQSTRTAAYASCFDMLSQQQLVYPCYCSRQQLHAASAPHQSDGTLRYPGTCRNLTPAQRAAQTKAPAWRIAVPDRMYAFTDGLFGLQRENLQQSCGDFILRRSDGVYAYQLAVVCDDHAGGVTEVVRGSDLLSSTPRQLFLMDCLNFTPPQYFHVPLLTDAQGRRLSKRDQDLDLGALRQRMQPQTLLGHLAHAAGLLDRSVSISARELAEQFDWKLVHRQNAISVQALRAQISDT